MNLDGIKDFFSQFDIKDIPTGAAVLVGIVLLILVFKSGRALNRFLLFSIAAALFAGAYWWHKNK